MNEVWKTVVFFEEYRVSNLGRVANSKGMIMSCTDDGKGYLKVNLAKDGKQFTRAVHILVAMAFIELPDHLLEADLTVNHRDRNKKNNRVDNLEWMERSENCSIDQQGEDNQGAVLTEDVVRQIRRSAYSGLIVEEIARIMSLNHSTVHSVVNLKTWLSIELAWPKEQYLAALSKAGSLENRRSFTEMEVKDIRKLSKEGLNSREIGKIYNRDSGSIRNVIRRHTYKHIP